MRIVDMSSGPAFQLTVDIPRPGHEPARIRFSFRYRGRAELHELTGRLEKLEDSRAVAEVITGWDLADEFNAQNIRALCETLPGAGYAIVQAYLDASFGTRRH